MQMPNLGYIDVWLYHFLKGYTYRFKPYKHCVKEKLIPHMREAFFSVFSTLFSEAKPQNALFTPFGFYY